MKWPYNPKPAPQIEQDPSLMRFTKNSMHGDVTFVHLKWLKMRLGCWGMFSHPVTSCVVCDDLNSDADAEHWQEHKVI